MKEQNVIYLVEKTMSHNIKDCAKFWNEADAVRCFIELEGMRRLGFKFGECEDNMFFLVADRQNEPQLIAEGMADGKEAQKLRERMLLTLSFEFQKQAAQEAQRLLEMASAPTAGRSGRINFKKEIAKRMQVCKKTFRNCRMEGYDFRDIDLSDSIFVNCFLSNSNFSGCNLQNAVFINCKLDGTTWQNAYLNNAFLYGTRDAILLAESCDVKKGQMKWEEK